MTAPTDHSRGPMLADRIEAVPVKEDWTSQLVDRPRDYDYVQLSVSVAERDVIVAALRASRPVAETDDRAVELAKMRERKDAAYLERNQVVAALAKCFPSGVARTAIEGWSDGWHGCVYIDLPTGQVSWHFHDSHAYLFAGLPPYRGAWDGHDTPEKYNRLAALPGPSPKPTREGFTVEPSIPADGFNCWWIRDAAGFDVGYINGPQDSARQAECAKAIAAALAAPDLAKDRG